jgi:nifR3 family TIM-barrel protein
MVHSNSVIFGHPKNRRILNTLKNDGPNAAQLLGADPSLMLDAAQKLTALADISFIDVNSACPAKKVIKKGEGAALLKNRTRLGRIIKKMSSKLPIPVTVKLRTGFNKKDVRACVRTALVCQENGASTIFIHGRTRSQGYSGEIDYETIKAVKSALKIPVFGSGNIFNCLMAEKMFTETGCDGVMVARGALGRPWIFRDIMGYLKDGVMPQDQTFPVKIKVLKRHLDYMNRYNDIKADHKIGSMGRVTMWYIKGFYNAARIREKVFKSRSYDELIDLIDSANHSNRV